MGRKFYTEQDIEDLARQGITEITVDDSVYITDVAREKMKAMGIRAKSKPQGDESIVASGTRLPDVFAGSSTPLTSDEKTEVIEKVKSGVIARLGPGVDVSTVDSIVRQVVDRL